MSDVENDPWKPRFTAIQVTNFLSYKVARLEIGDLIALVGPNASGKSNLASAIKLLREIPIHGLPIALARRGGFDQLRHRSAGRPNDPSLRVEFFIGESLKPSFYELSLGAVSPRSYRVKSESAEIWTDQLYSLKSDGKKVTFTEPSYDDESEPPKTSKREFPVAPGQSALSTGGLAGFLVYQTLQRMQTVEINPAKVADLQEPSATQEFESDGSNSTSVFESLDTKTKTELIDELNAIVPGIVRIEVQHLADKQTLAFIQETSTGNREFYAKQMSDGTLRAFSILLAMKQPRRPGLFVIEEPEVAIHLGALRTLVEVLK